jgi:hypothetical protein
MSGAVTLAFGDRPAGDLELAFEADRSRFRALPGGREQGCGLVVLIQRYHRPETDWQTLGRGEAVRRIKRDAEMEFVFNSTV